MVVGRHGTGGSEVMLGMEFEAALYNVVVSGSDLSALMAGLKTKYGL